MVQTTAGARVEIGFCPSLPIHQSTGLSFVPPAINLMEEVIDNSLS